MGNISNVTGKNLLFAAKKTRAQLLDSSQTPPETLGVASDTKELVFNNEVISPAGGGSISADTPAAQRYRRMAMTLYMMGTTLSALATLSTNRSPFIGACLFNPDAAGEAARPVSFIPSSSFPTDIKVERIIVGETALDTTAAAIESLPPTTQIKEDVRVLDSRFVAGELLLHYLTIVSTKVSGHLLHIGTAGVYRKDL